MEYFNQNQFSNFRIHSALLVIKLPLNSILISENTLKRGNITHHTRIMGCIALLCGDTKTKVAINSVKS